MDEAPDRENDAASRPIIRSDNAQNFQRKENQHHRSVPPKAIKQEDSHSTSQLYPRPSNSTQSKSSQQTPSQPTHGQSSASRTQRTTERRLNTWVTPKQEPDEDVEMRFLQDEPYRRTPHAGSANPSTHSQFQSHSPAGLSPATRGFDHRGAPPNHDSGWSLHSQLHSQPHEFRNRGSFAQHSNTPTPELLSPGPAYSSGGSSYVPSTSSDTSSVTNTPDHKPIDARISGSHERRIWNGSLNADDRRHGVMNAIGFEFGHEERRGRPVRRQIDSPNRFDGRFSQGETSSPSSDRADVFALDPGDVPQSRSFGSKRGSTPLGPDVPVEEAYIQRSHPLRSTWSVPYTLSSPIRFDRAGNSYVESREESAITQEYYEQW